MKSHPGAEYARWVELRPVPTLDWVLQPSSSHSPCACQFCQLPADAGGPENSLFASPPVIASDDAIFAWAIGKAVLIAIASFGALVYLAWWGVTYQEKYTTHVESPRNSSLEVQEFRKGAKVLPIADGAVPTHSG
jgi:hypothetical protein